MKPEVLDAGDEPQPLSPALEGPGPVRPIETGGFQRFVVSGRRAHIEGVADAGVTQVTVDGVTVGVPPSDVLPRQRFSADDRIVVGIDRLYRAGADDRGAFEELWLIPLALPFVVQRWSTAESAGTMLYWTPPDDEAAARRLRRVAASWPAMTRSWDRDLGEAGALVRDGRPDDRWTSACAALISSVHTGPNRDEVRARPGGGPVDSAEAAWIALGLCAIGRGDLAPVASKRISDLSKRAHVEQWMTRWEGSSGDHPPEGGGPYPASLHVGARTDAPLQSWSATTETDAVSSAAWCGRIVDELFGIRPDTQFGRIRFGPTTKSELGPSVGGHVALLGLTVGRTPGPIILSLSWQHDEMTGGRVSHTYEVVPEIGAVPLQLVFEPRLYVSDVEAVTLEGREVEADISGDAAAGYQVRLQCPLEGVRTLRVICAR